MIKGLYPDSNTGKGEKQYNLIVNRQHSCRDNTRLTHDNTVQGSNPITGNLTKKITKRSSKICSCLSSTVVEHSAHDPNIKGLNHATVTGRGGKA